MSILTGRTIPTLTKDPDAVLVYRMDWSDWLAEGAEIQTSTWAITGGDAALTKANDDIDDDSEGTSVKLSGGTVGVTYTVTNRIVTNETPAQTDDRSFKVLIKQR